MRYMWDHNIGDLIVEASTLFANPKPSLYQPLKTLQRDPSTLPTITITTFTQFMHDGGLPRGLDRLI